MQIRMLKNHLVLIRRTYLIILLLLLLQYSCGHYGGKGEHIYTEKVCSNLYVEGYRTYEGGALGSDITKDYLTDSVNFRVYIGSFDNSSTRNAVECEKKDTVVIYKLSRLEGDSVFKARKINFYNIDSLKKLQNYGAGGVESKEY